MWGQSATHSYTSQSLARVAATPSGRKHISANETSRQDDVSGVWDESLLVFTDY